MADCCAHYFVPLLSALGLPFLSAAVAGIVEKILPVFRRESSNGSSNNNLPKIRYFEETEVDSIMADSVCMTLKKPWLSG